MNALPHLTTFFDWLWRTSWQASVLIILVLIVQRLFRKYLPPRWLSALWLLVILRLLWPWQYEHRASVFNLLPSNTPQISQLASIEPTPAVPTTR